MGYSVIPLRTDPLRILLLCVVHVTASLIWQMIPALFSSRWICSTLSISKLMIDNDEETVVIQFDWYQVKRITESIVCGLIRLHLLMLLAPYTDLCSLSLSS